MINTAFYNTETREISYLDKQGYKVTNKCKNILNAQLKVEAYSLKGADTKILKR